MLDTDQIIYRHLGADDVPPPKPSRQPQNTTDQSQLTAAAPVSTYIVAQSPEVLAQLLKDNQTRGVCPSVYTTPASPFNTLAVQFQDEEQVLTTALVSDLPFFDPAISEPSASHDTHSGDSTLSDTNLDSLDSSDTPLMSSLNISDTTQAQSPAANRKQQKVKEMQNLYAVSSKVVGNITGDLYSPVQKFTTSNAIPVTTSVATCGEIYGPVANFTQSSAIIGNLSQSPSIGGNFGENPGNFGPSSLNSIVGLANQNQLNFNQFSANNTSQTFGVAPVSQNSSCIQNPATAVVYPRVPIVSSASVAIPSSNTECLYGPVLKFRAQNIQNQNVSDLKPVSVGSAIPNARSNLAHISAPGQNLQPMHAQSYQQIYSNISHPGTQPMYMSQSQNVQNIQKQNPIHQPVSYIPTQYTNQQNQATGANPIYTAQAASVTVVQAQKIQAPVYVQQIQAGIASHVPCSQAMNVNQQLSFEIAQSHPVHFATSGGSVQPANQQHVHPSISNIVMGQQSTSVTAAQHVSTQGSVANLPATTTNATQYLPQPLMQTGIIRSNAPQMATGVAKITTFVNQKQDEQLTSSTDGTLSGSLISSAVSDSTMSSSSSMTEEAQQDQV